MKKFLIFFGAILIGVILTLIVAKVFNIQEFFPGNTIDTSEDCGELKIAMYCYRESLLCTTRCNLCACEVPYCEEEYQICGSTAEDSAVDQESVEDQVPIDQTSPPPPSF